jgi:hypothetical protein
MNNCRKIWDCQYFKFAQILGFYFDHDLTDYIFAPAALRQISIRPHANCLATTDRQGIQKGVENNYRWHAEMSLRFRFAHDRDFLAGGA